MHLNLCRQSEQCQWKVIRLISLWTSAHDTFGVKQINANVIWHNFSPVKRELGGSEQLCRHWTFSLCHMKIIIWLQASPIHTIAASKFSFVLPSKLIVVGGKSTNKPYLILGQFEQFWNSHWWLYSVKNIQSSHLSANNYFVGLPHKQKPPRPLVLTTFCNVNDAEWFPWHHWLASQKAFEINLRIPCLQHRTHCDTPFSELFEDENLVPYPMSEDPRMGIQGTLSLQVNYLMLWAQFYPLLVNYSMQLTSFVHLCSDSFARSFC